MKFMPKSEIQRPAHGLNCKSFGTAHIGQNVILAAYKYAQVLDCECESVNLLHAKFHIQYVAAK